MKLFLITLVSTDLTSRLFLLRSYPLLCWLAVIGFCLGPELLSFCEAVERSAGRGLGFESQLLSSQGLKPIV